MTSSIKTSENLVLFPAAASLAPGGQEWIIPVHAWVYVPQLSRVRRTAIAALLKAQHGLEITPASEPYFNARVNLLLADNKRGRRIVVDIAGLRTVLPPTDPNGHVAADVRLPVSLAQSGNPPLEIKAILPAGDARAITAPLQLIPPKGLSVISDIDDTVKITHVTDRKRMWQSTFYAPFAAVPGMAEAYQRLAKSGNPGFHYISSSPWHLAEPLQQFITDAGLPLSQLSLKHIRLKDRTALNIISPGRVTKPPAIAQILARFPERTFIMIGDSGEDDPEVYAAAISANAGQIAHIYIRNVTGARRDDARFSVTFAGIAAEQWTLFDDPSVIRAP
jgi:phosphatidate phosphatase APP1